MFKINVEKTSKLKKKVHINEANMNPMTPCK